MLQKINPQVVAGFAGASQLADLLFQRWLVATNCEWVGVGSFSIAIAISLIFNSIISIFVKEFFQQEKQSNSPQKEPLPNRYLSKLSFRTALLNSASKLTSGYLKEIGDQCGIHEIIISHTTRHTFTTLANEVPSRN